MLHRYFSPFLDNYHTVILITSRKHDLCADEEPKYEKKVIDVFLREMDVLNGGVG